jgi:hypothetical protein
MKNTRDIPWIRLFSEATAIVVSILLAFSIEAWWEGRQLAEEEQSALLQLRSEFIRNVEILEDKRNNHVAVEQSMLTLLQYITDRKAEDLSQATVLNDLDKAIIRWTFEAETSVLSSLIGSGKLSIIQSDMLRNALGGWPAKIQDVVEDEMAIWNFTGSDFVPYLYDKSSFRTMYNSNEPTRQVGVGPYATDVEEILADRMFENLALRKLALTRDVLDGYDVLTEYAKNVVNMIDIELTRFS